MLENLTNVEFRQFCGIPISEVDGVLYMCGKPAGGELTAMAEDGKVVEVPICDGCFEKAQEKFDITVE